MWLCPKCSEKVDDQFEACWNCQTAKPAVPVEVPDEPDPPVEWADNFLESPLPDGFIEVEAFGRKLTCTVCGRQSFWEQDGVMNKRLPGIFQASWNNDATVNYICSNCGHIFWFLPQTNL